MTNWFQTHNIHPIYGWGPSKRWIVQGGVEAPSDSSSRVEMETFTEQMRVLVDKARKAGCVYVEIRCFEDYSAFRSALEAAGFVYEPHYDVHIDPAKEVPEPKMRQIRSAMSEGQIWRETRDEADIAAWYACLKRLYRTKVRRPIPSLDWFREMIVEKGCKLLVVERHPQSPSKKGDVIGGVMLAVEDDRSKAYEWYICGQVMSTWAAIDWCRQNDIKCFDTMGAGKPGVSYGVRDFKLQMGGTLHEFGRYRCVLKPRLYRLGEWLMKR